jgi:hypothetical protein
LPLAHVKDQVDGRIVDLYPTLARTEDVATDHARRPAV